MKRIHAGISMRSLAAAAAYAIITLVVFLPALRPGAILSHADISFQHVHYMTYLRESILSGRLPLWNPYTFLGQPFLANPSVAFWYPLTWLFFVLPVQTAFVVHFMFHVWWSMLGIFVLIRSVLNRKNGLFLVAAWAGGLVFGLSGHSMGHVFAGHYDLVASGSWIGWVLYCVLLTVRRPDRVSAAMLSLAVGFQLLSGHVTQSVYTFLAAAILGVVGIVGSKANRFAIGMWVGAGMILGMLVSMIQMLPNWEFMHLTVRAAFQEYAWHAQGSIPPKQFLQLIFPFPSGVPHSPYAPGTPSVELMMFVGITAAMLTLFGIASLLNRTGHTRERRILGWSMAATLVFGVWCAMGTYATPDLDRLLWNAFPPYRFLRIPGRFVYLVDMAVSVLAGLGLSRLMEGRFSGVRRMLGAVAVVSLLIEFIPYTRIWVGTGKYPENVVDRSVRTFLTGNLGPGERVHETESYEFWYDAPVTYRIPSTTGYDIAFLRDPYAFVTAVMDVPEGKYTEDRMYQVPAGHPLLRFLSVRYALEYPGLRADMPDALGQHKVGAGVSPYYEYAIYRNERILPLWYLVPEGRGYADRESLYRAIRSKRLDYETTVGFVGTVPGIPGAACTSVDEHAVRMLTVKPEEVIMRVDTTCGGYLTGSQVYFPGWTATVDGKSIPLYRGNLGFSAIVMPAGKHEVVLRFHSTYLPLGAGISVLVFILIIGMMLPGRLGIPPYRAKAE